MALGAGVVDGDIEATEAGDSLIDQTTNIVLMAHVGAEERGLGAKVAQFGLQRLAFGVAAAGDDERCAFASRRPERWRGRCR